MKNGSRLRKPQAVIDREIWLNLLGWRRSRSIGRSSGSGCGGAAAASRSGTARGGSTSAARSSAARSCTAAVACVTARSGAAWSCTARSTAARSVVVNASWLATSLTALSSRCIASHQGQSQQAAQRKHDITDHFELLARPRNIHLLSGGSETPTCPDKPSLVRTGVYVDISSESSD